MMLILKKKLEKLIHRFESKYLSYRLSNKEKWKTVASFRGCKIWAGSDNKIEKTIFLSGHGYDDTNFCIIEKLVKPGDTCLDIGANIGVYSMVFSKISGRPENTHSFEPVNHIRSKLMANARLNGYTSININNFALGDRAETIQMYQVKEGIFRAGTSSLLKNENVQTMGEDKFDFLPVEVKTLDSYAKEKGLTSIDFIKIDVEGFEFNVLEGGKSIIGKTKPYILLEYDEVRHAPQKADFAAYFQELNYDVYEFYAIEDQPVFMPYDFTRNPVFRNILAVPRLF